MAIPLTSPVAVHAPLTDARPARDRLTPGRVPGPGGGSRLARRPSENPDRLGRRLSRGAKLLAIGAAAAVGLTLLSGSTPAWAAITPTFYTNASPSTSVGRSVFDHTNLSGASPTGTIAFTLYGPGDTTCATPVFTSTVSVSGTGSDNSPRYTTASAGTYNWVAAYSGDADNNAVTSACGSPSQVLVVDKAGPVETTTPGFGGGALHASTTLSYGSAPLTGSITYTVTGPKDQFCAGTPVYTSTVPVNGAGSYDSGPFTPTTPGTYTYRILYSGDANNYGIGPTTCLSQGASVSVTPGQLGQAAITNPTPGGVKNTATPFTWSAATGAQRYSLSVGTSSGAGDLVKVDLPAGTQSYDVSMLPAGTPLYARLSTMTNGVWSAHQDVSFKASDGAVFTSPTDGDASAAPGPLRWTMVAGADNYAVLLGSTPGGYDLGLVELPGDTTSYDAPLPVAKRVYARVWTMVHGAWARWQDISYTTTGGATFSSPINGETGVGVLSSLNWGAVAGAQFYAVWVGTTPGGYDLAAVGLPPALTSYTALNLPIGLKLYARVWTMTGGAWARYQDISFTTAAGLGLGGIVKG